LFQNQDDHHALLYRMATNECINYLRKHKRSHALDFLEVNDLSDHSDQREETENRLDVKRILKLFEKKSREIAWLYFIEGHTQEQIAGLLQISRKTVNRKITKVKQKLGIKQ
jgi:RNA polymerase sigma factor (sigma-70 family)